MKIRPLLVSPEVAKILETHAQERAWRCLDDDGHPHKAVWAHEKMAAATEPDQITHYADVGMRAWFDELSRKQKRESDKDLSPVILLNQGMPDNK